MRRIHVFVKNGIILTASSLFSRLLSMGFTVFLSNKIPSNIIGTWGLLMSVFTFLLTIALSGINLASTRLISEEKTYGNQHNIPNILKSCLKYSAFFSIFSIVIAVIFSKYISHNVLKNLIPIYLIYVLSLSLPFCSVCSCLTGYFMAMEKVFVIAISQIIEIAIQIIVVLVFYYFFVYSTIEIVCLSLVLSVVISEISSCLYLICAYRRETKSFFKRATKNYTQHVCKISLPVAFTTYVKAGLSTLKNSQIPLALVSYGLTYTSALSYYGLISTTVLSLILFPYTLIQSYGSLLIPKISTYSRKTDISKIENLSYKSIKATCIFSILTCVIFILFSKTINNKMYSSLQISLYIKILAPIIIYIYMDNVIDNLLKSLDFQVFVMAINILDLVVSICFIKFLIPKFGITGYIFVLYFSEIFNFTLSLAALKFKIKRLKD